MQRVPGFSLIEMSVVLIIIGLVIGAIAVGRDLVHAAEIRKQIKQIQELEMQINLFYAQYKCLPGDCPNATDIFGTTDPNGHPVVNGNGDGLIFSSAGGYTASDCLLDGPIGPEVSQVWMNLNESGFGNYTVKWNSSGASYYETYPTALNPDAAFAVSCTAGTVAPANFRQGNWIILGMNPVNCGRFVGCMGYNSTSTLANNNAFKAADAQAMDQKIDDGMPNSGKFGVMSGCIVGTSSYTPPTTSCVWGGSFQDAPDAVTVGKRLEIGN